ncbi:hypothetical protein [Streptomyces sp. NPDC053755]|uniref:hypothetical protein n=1 Tax=Streptomyces sp. NPDC053755 TaxID=3155815 RepID=UPI00341D127B
MRGTRTALAVTAVAVAVTVAGCAAPTGADAGSGPAGRTASAPPSGPALSEAERRRIEDAQQGLIGACMERHGFRYARAVRPAPAADGAKGYVSDDVAWARAHGYGSRIDAAEDRARLANPNIAYRASLPEPRRRAFDAALDGGPGTPVLETRLPTGGTVRRRLGGCLAESENKLYGDTEAWFRAHKTASNLQPLYVPRVLADKEFRAALGAWARCMERAGHPSKDPQEARRTAERRGRGRPEPEAFAAERRLAVADAACARTTSLKTVGRARETYYVNALPRPYREAVATALAMERAALARARDLTRRAG